MSKEDVEKERSSFPSKVFLVKGRKTYKPSWSGEDKKGLRFSSADLKLFIEPEKCVELTPSELEENKGNVIIDLTKREGTNLYGIIERDKEPIKKAVELIYKAIDLTHKNLLKKLEAI